MKTAERPLDGRRILLTRPSGRAESLAARLTALGAEVDCRPTIALEAPADPEPARRALDSLPGYDWILFTSPAGVRFFLALRRRRPVAARIAAVGPATARDLRQAGLVPSVVARDSRAEGLAEALRGRIRPGDNVLVVRPEVAREVLLEALREMGAEPDPVVFYRNVPAPGTPEVASDVRSGRYDTAVFSSSSTFERLIAAGGPEPEDLLDALRSMRLVAIGPVTASSIERAGLKTAAVASEPTDDAIAECLLATGEVRATMRGPVTKDGRLGKQTLRRTPMHGAHLRAGARMVAFAGWHMPVSYSGLIDEHMAVRERAGLFDVSHMGEAAVRGAQALDFLQWVTCNDVSRLRPGRAQYTALTTPEGTFVDDLLIYQLEDGEYLLVVNAANTAKDLRWLTEHAGRFDVGVEDVSADWAQLALQGPRAESCLQPLLDESLQGIRPFSFLRAELRGVSCIVSRTGYTGEDGFEIYAPTEGAATLWDAVLEAGAAHGVVPIGLGARDTLRLEAKLALYGNDIDDTTTVLEADLGWIVKLKKGEFLGRDVLARQKEEGVSRKLAGFEMRGRPIARPGYSVTCGGEPVGKVTSGTHSPYLRKNIGLTYLPVSLAEPGQELHVEIRGRAEEAFVVPTPFYKRAN